MSRCLEGQDVQFYQLTFAGWPFLLWLTLDHTADILINWHFIQTYFGPIFIKSLELKNLLVVRSFGTQFGE